MCLDSRTWDQIYMNEVSRFYIFWSRTEYLHAIEFFLNSKFCWYNSKKITWLLVKTISSWNYITWQWNFCWALVWNDSLSSSKSMALWKSEYEWMEQFFNRVQSQKACLLRLPVNVKKLEESCIFSWTIRWLNRLYLFH